MVFVLNYSVGETTVIARKRQAEAERRQSNPTAGVAADDRIGMPLDTVVSVVCRSRASSR